MEATKNREERLAAMRARREAGPRFGDEVQVAAQDVKAGDFLVRTPRVDWTGSRGGRYYQPAYRVETIVTATPTYSTAADEPGVRFVGVLHGETVGVPAEAMVLIRRRIV